MPLISTTKAQVTRRDSSNSLNDHFLLIVLIVSSVIAVLVFVIVLTFSIRNRRQRAARRRFKSSSVAEFLQVPSMVNMQYTKHQSSVHLEQSNFPSPWKEDQEVDFSLIQESDSQANAQRAPEPSFPSQSTQYSRISSQNLPHVTNKKTDSPPKSRHGLPSLKIPTAMAEVSIVSPLRFNLRRVNTASSTATDETGSAYSQSSATILSSPQSAGVSAALPIGFTFNVPDENVNSIVQSQYTQSAPSTTLLYRISSDVPPLPPLPSSLDPPLTSLQPTSTAFISSHSPKLPSTLPPNIGDKSDSGAHLDRSSTRVISQLLLKRAAKRGSQSPSSKHLSASQSDRVPSRAASRISHIERDGSIRTVRSEDSIDNEVGLERARVALANIRAKRAGGRERSGLGQT